MRGHKLPSSRPLSPAGRFSHDRFGPHQFVHGLHFLGREDDTAGLGVLDRLLRIAGATQYAGHAGLSKRPSNHRLPDAGLMALRDGGKPSQKRIA